MGFTLNHPFSKDVTTVFGMFTDPNYLTEKFTALGATNLELVEHGEKDGKFIIICKRDIPTNPPGFAKKILKSTNTIVETDIWDLSDPDVKRGTYTVDIKGTPITVTGTMTLSPTDTGSVNVVETEAKVSIPLIGGKIAAFIEDDTRNTLDNDYEYTKKYLDKITS